MENINSMSLQQKQDLADLTEATLKQAMAELTLAKAKQQQILKDNTKTTAWQKLKNGFVAIASPGAGIANNIADAALNGAEAAATMNDGISELEGQIKQMQSRTASLNEVLNSEQMADAISGKKLTGSQLQEKQRYLNIALNNYAKGTEEFIRIQKKLAAVEKQMGSGSSSPGTGKAVGAIEKKVGEYVKLTTKVADLNQELQDMLALGKTPTPEFLANLKAQEQKVIDITNAMAVAKNGFESYLKLDPDQPVPDNTDYTIPEDKNPITGEPMAVGDKMSPEEKKAYAVEQAQVTSDAVFAIVRNNQQAEFDEKMSLLDKQREAELNNANLTEEQKNAIREKYAKKEAALKREQFKKQKAADIIQAVISTALAIIKAAPNPFMMAAAGIAGAASIATITSQKMPEFSQGGYTASSASNQTPAGVVHANEYVVPADGVNNPRLRPILDMLEVARQNGNLPSLDARSVIRGMDRGRGFIAGGFTSQNEKPGNNSGNNSGSIADMIAANNSVMLALLQKLKEPIPIEATVAIRGRNGLYEKLEEDKQSQKNAYL
jgi:hypothetical protein